MLGTCLDELVLSTCLDELAPQTRKLLRLIHEMVSWRCREQSIDHSKCLFTRREVRDYTRLSNTEVKRHLDQLVDMEYLISRRGRWGSQYVYELLYRGEGESDERFLMGLLDVEQLRQKLPH